MPLGHVLVRKLTFDVSSFRAEEDLYTLPLSIGEAVSSAMRLQAFYQRNATDMFLQREVSDILRQMKGEKVLTVELQRAGRSEIVAASILWDYKLPIIERASIKVARFVEVGTQRCILNGFNIQQLLNAASILDALVHDPTGVYFGAVYTVNTATVDNVTRNSGYVPWPDVPSTLEAMLSDRSDTEETGKRLRFFRADINSLVSAARFMNAHLTNLRQERSARRTADLQAEPAGEETVRMAGAGAAFRSPGDDLTEIEFQWEARLWQPLQLCAERIVEQRPPTLEALRLTMENHAISEDFLFWPNQPRHPAGPGWQNWFRRLFGL